MSPMPVIFRSEIVVSAAAAEYRTSLRFPPFDMMAAEAKHPVMYECSRERTPYEFEQSFVPLEALWECPSRDHSRIVVVREFHVSVSMDSKLGRNWTDARHLQQSQKVELRRGLTF